MYDDSENLLAIIEKSSFWLAILDRNVDKPLRSFSSICSLVSEILIVLLSFTWK